MLHDWGDSVPCDQARERSMEQSRPCQRVPRGAARRRAEPDQPAEERCFSTEKGNMRERMFNAGLLVRSISAVIERARVTLQPSQQRRSKYRSSSQATVFHVRSK